MKFRFKSTLCIICLSFMTAAMTTEAFSASNQHIKLEGIEGESEDCALMNSPKDTIKTMTNVTRGRAAQPVNKNTTGTIKVARNNSSTQKTLINRQKSRSCR